MGNLTTNYNHFSNIGRGQLAGVKPGQQLTEEERQALVDVRTTTQKLFSTGIAGDDAKDATATLGNIEKVSSLSQGDINAVNLKAAADLGYKTFVVEDLTVDLADHNDQSFLCVARMTRSEGAYSIQSDQVRRIAAQVQP